VNSAAAQDLPFNGLAVGLDGELYAGRGRGLSGGRVDHVVIQGGVGQLEPLPDLVPYLPNNAPRIKEIAAVVPETPTSLIAIGARFGQILRYFTDGRPTEFLGGNVGLDSVSKCLDGSLRNAQFNDPHSAAFLSPGRLLVEDRLCKSIRLVDLTSNRASTLYGSLGYGTADGKGADASFHGISGLAYSSPIGGLMTSEMLGLLVRSVAFDGTTRTLAGEPTNAPGQSTTGKEGVDGIGPNATFGNPSALTINSSASTFVLDRGLGPNKLRRIDPDGRVTTIRNDVPFANSHKGLTFDSFQQYLATDSQGRFVVPSGNAIWRFSESGPLERLAGTGDPNYLDGDASVAMFKEPSGVVVASDGSVYVADSGNHVIRRIAPNGSVTTISGTENLPSSTFHGSDHWMTPAALALTEAQDFLVVLDVGEYLVKAIDLRPDGRYATRIVAGTSFTSALALGPLPGSLAPPYVGPEGSLQLGGGWGSHALAVKRSKLYIALGDAILEADLALR
jgi:hypothetical protein